MQVQKVLDKGNMKITMQVVGIIIRIQVQNRWKYDKEIRFFDEGHLTPKHKYLNTLLIYTHCRCSYRVQIIDMENKIDIGTMHNISFS